MGWPWESKTKIDVFANTFQLAQSNPNAVQDAVLHALISGRSIVYNLLNLSLNGMANKVDQMRVYAETEYTLGLPSGSYNDEVLFDEAVVASAIATDVSAPYGVQVDFHCVDFTSLFYAMIPFLMSTRLWNPTRNTISNYPEAMELPLPSTSEVLYEYGVFEVPLYVVNVYSVVLSADESSVEITYQILGYTRKNTRYTDGTNNLEIEQFCDELYTEECPIPTNLPLGKKYCIAAYRTLDSGGTPEEHQQWWFYDVSTELYPSLNVNDSTEEINNLLPVIPLRYNNVDLTATNQQDTDLYITSKALVNKLGIDIDDISASLNENENVSDIDHAYLMFGVNLQTTNNTCIRYLVDFFDHLADQSTISLFDNIISRIRNSGASLQNTFTLFTDPEEPVANTPSQALYEWLAADGTTVSFTTVSNSSSSSLQEYGLNISLSYSYIQSDIVTEIIGPIGKATMAINEKEPSLIRFTDQSINPYLAASDLYNVTTDNSELILKLQITETACKRIIVKGLTHRNQIYGDAAVTTTLADLIDNEDENNIIIPIHYSIASKLPIYERGELYTESLNLILNSVVKTEVEWYERSFFKMILLAATIFVSIYTGQYWLNNLVLAAEAGTLAVLTYLLETIIFTMAISVAFEFVAEAIGPELAAILAVVAAAMSLGGGFKGNINFGIKTIPTAEALLFGSNALMQGAAKEIQNQLEDIEQELLDFTADAEAKIEKLEAAKELLEVEQLLSFDLLEAQEKRFVQPEVDSPTQFYDLTIHTGNIGTLVLDIVPTYCDIALTLPKPDTQLL